MKTIRRIVIIVCFILLLPIIATNLPHDKYLNNREIEALVDKGKSKVIEYDVKGKLDDDTFIVERIVFTENKTFLIYSVKKKEIGWNFPDALIDVYDDKGKKYDSRPGSGIVSGKKESGMLIFDKVNSNANKLLLELNRYDRNMKITIPLKEGEL